MLGIRFPKFRGEGECSIIKKIKKVLIPIARAPRFLAATVIVKHVKGITAMT